MKTHDFYYDLPEELIAQTPLERRDTSRLMTLTAALARRLTAAFMIYPSCSARATAWS